VAHEYNLEKTYYLMENSNLMVCIPLKDWLEIQDLARQVKEVLERKEKGETGEELEVNENSEDSK